MQTVLGALGKLDLGRCCHSLPCWENPGLAGPVTRAEMSQQLDLWRIDPGAWSQLGTRLEQLRQRPLP